MKKEVDSIDATELAAFVDPPEHVGAVPRVLRDAMYPTGALPNSYFQDLEELHSLEHGEFLQTLCQLILSTKGNAVVAAISKSSSGSLQTE